MITETILIMLGIVGAAIEEIIRQIVIPKFASSKFRSNHKIIDITGYWSCKWFYDDRKEPLEDEIEIVKWTKNSKFEGFGHQKKEIDGQTRVFNYPVSGEVSPSRIVVLTYKADKYPTQGNIGTASLHLDISGEKMSGYWCGLGSKKMDDGGTITALNHGKVECKLLK